MESRRGAADPQRPRCGRIVAGGFAGGARVFVRMSTAREAQHLQASVRDLQNALRLALGQAEPGPLARAGRGADSLERDPSARILANNDRGVIRDIQRVRRLGVAVVGLGGVGSLVAEAFARYGVQDLVVVDDSPVDAADLDTIPFVATDEGHSKEERIAARLRRLNPDVGVRVLGASISDAEGVVRALKALAVVTELSTDADASETDVEESNAYDEHEHVPLSLVVLCTRDGELALRLNDLYCQLGVPFALGFMGVDGISGESLLVIPGVSSCLQCLEKRKVWKLPVAATVNSDGSEEDDEEDEEEDSVAHASRRPVGPVLPSTDCILAGLCVQNALMHLLSFGSACSRVEYDGFLEGLERSELVPPVVHCPSRRCQQRRRSLAAKTSAQ